MTKKFARNFFKTVDIFAKPKIILTAKFCPQNMVSLYCIDSINAPLRLFWRCLIIVS